MRPLCRQLIKTKPSPARRNAADGARGRDGLPLPAAGRGSGPRDDRPVAALGFAEEVDQSLVPDRLVRLAHRFPPAAGIGVEEAWAGLYDMTPDAHPIVGRIGEGLYAACGFSGHGFMQSPAVGLAVAEEILRGSLRSICRLPPRAVRGRGRLSGRSRPLTGLQAGKPGGNAHRCEIPLNRGPKTYLFAAVGQLNDRYGCIGEPGGRSRSLLRRSLSDASA